MSSQETVRQHFVPRTYLKHFADDPNRADKVYCSLLNDANPDSPRSESVNNLCVYKRLYTLSGDTIEERMALEDFYSSTVEAQYNALYTMLVDEKVVIITDDIRDRILHTVVTMMMRTTKRLNQSNQLMERVIDRMFELCIATGSDIFDFEGNEISIKGKTPDEIKREFKARSQQGKVLTQLQLALNLAENRKDDFGILIVKLDEEAGDYITSDNPVIVWGLERQPTAFYPGTSLRLPIDSKHMLMLMPDTVPQLKHNIIRWNLEGEHAKLDRMAACMLQQSNAERWIIGTQKGLRTHIQERVALQEDYDKQSADTPIDNMQAIAERMKRLGLL